MEAKSGKILLCTNFAFRCFNYANIFVNKYVFLYAQVPRVVSLDLSKRSIKGSMPANWFAENFSAMGASLSALHTIDMSDNKLEGMGLPRFATLETLTVLDLSENSLRGDLTALALPPSLVVLNLDYNYFKGPVEASWFTNLSNLTSLRLTGNRLNCEVPRKCWYVWVVVGLMLLCVFL